MTKKKGKEKRAITFQSLQNDPIVERCKNLMYVLEHQKEIISKREGGYIFITLFEKAIYYNDYSDIDILKQALPDIFTKKYIERTKTKLYAEIDERISKYISSTLAIDGALANIADIAKNVSLPIRIVRKHLNDLEASDYSKLKRAKLKLAFENTLFSCYQDGANGDIKQRELFLKYTQSYLFEK